MNVLKFSVPGHVVSSTPSLPPLPTDACSTWLPLTTYSYSYFPPQPFLLKMMGIYEYDEHCIQANKQMRKVIRLPEVVINISLMKSLMFEFSLYNTHTHTHRKQFEFVCMKASELCVCLTVRAMNEWLGRDKNRMNLIPTHTHTHNMLMFEIILCQKTIGVLGD